MADKLPASFGAAPSFIHTTAAANSLRSGVVVGTPDTRASAAICWFNTGIVSVRTA
jgi:hypothetical protein